MLDPKLFRTSLDDERTSSLAAVGTDYLQRPLQTLSKRGKSYRLKTQEMQALRNANAKADRKG